MLASAAAVGILAAAPADARDKLLVVAHRAETQVGLYKAEGASLTLVKSLPVGKTPRELCLSPDGTRAYVSAQEGNSITIVDLDALSVAGTIEGEALKGADGCTVSPDGRKLYVVSTGRDSLVIVSTAEKKVLKEVKLPLGVPRRVVFNPANDKLYVGSNKTPEIAVVDVAKETVDLAFKVGNEARGGLAFTPDGKQFLVGNVEDDTLSIVETATHKVTKTVGTPISPQRVIVSKDGQFAYRHPDPDRRSRDHAGARPRAGGGHLPHLPPARYRQRDLPHRLPRRLQGDAAAESGDHRLPAGDPEWSAGRAQLRPGASPRGGDDRAQ